VGRVEGRNELRLETLSATFGSAYPPTRLPAYPPTRLSACP
jgi:hypothetical protein